MARPRKSQQALLNLFKDVVMKVSEEDAKGMLIVEIDIEQLS